MTVGGISREFDAVNASSREFRRGDHIQRVLVGGTVTRSDHPGTRAYSAYDVSHGGRLAEKGDGDVESAVVVVGEARHGEPRVRAARRADSFDHARRVQRAWRIARATEPTVRSCEQLGSLRGRGERGCGRHRGAV